MVNADKKINYPPVTQASEKEISYDTALAIANKAFNYRGEVIISFPSEKDTSFNIRKLDDSQWSTVGHDVLVLDAYGNVLQKKLFKEIPLNERIASAIKPLHTGTIFGGLSKFLYFLACLIATSLPITGILIWWNKLKKNKKWYLS